MHRSTPSFIVRSLAALAVAIPTIMSAQTRVAEKPVTLASSSIEAAPARSPRKAPPAPTALESAAKDIEAASAAGGFRHPRTGVLIPAGAAQAVVALMTSPSAEADAQVIDALMRSNQSRGAAEHVTRAIPGLLEDPSSSHVRSAQHALASFMEDAPQWYREHPPAEVLAIDAIIARLAAIDSSAHAASRARKDAGKAVKPASAKRETKPAKNEKPKNEKKNDKPAKLTARPIAPVSAPTPAPVAAKSTPTPTADPAAPAKRLSPRQEKALREKQEKEAKALREKQEKEAKAQAKSEQNAQKKAQGAPSDSTRKKTSLWRKLVPFA